MLRMNQVLAFGRHTGLRLAEVGYLLILFAGIWLAVACTDFPFGSGHASAELAVSSEG